MTCFECDEPADHQHHVVPRSMGGTRTIPLCALCHATVHDTGITTSDLTARALRAKASRGEYTGGPNVPYGYRVSADGVHLEEHATEQMVIATIREYRAAGLSLRKISVKLIEHGFTPRKGPKFSPNTINRVAKSQRIIEQAA